MCGSSGSSPGSSVSSVNSGSARRDASLEHEVRSHVPDTVDLDTLLLRIVPVEDAPYPEGRFARTVAVDLEVRPLHVERRDIELHSVLEPGALEARLVVLELVRLELQWNEPRCGRARRVVAAEAEPLAVQQVHHPVVVEFVLGSELEDGVAVRAGAFDAPADECARQARRRPGHIRAGVRVPHRHARRHVRDVDLVPVVLEPARPARHGPLLGELVGQLAEHGLLLDGLVEDVLVVDVGRRDRILDVVPVHIWRRRRSTAHTPRPASSCRPGSSVP